MPDSPETTYVADLEADNRRLRRLLDQRDAPGELRHRLQSTLAMLRIIIRKSAETSRDLDAYVGHLEDRLDALARAQSAADQAGGVELHRLLADELFHYGAEEGERVFLAGPVIHLRPRAGQVMGLALHELAVNALEHGALRTPSGRIDVTWEVAPAEGDPLLTMIWKERGLANLAASEREGFGTEVLTRSIVYELKGSTSLALEADGLRCTLQFPLSERTGEVEPE